MSHYETRTVGTSTVVQPTGRLNMVAAPRLREQLRDLVENGSHRLVVDLSTTEFIDSSGLGALVSGLKAARQAGGDLRIARPTPTVLNVFKLTNLDRVLRPRESVEGAFDD